MRLEAQTVLLLLALALFALLALMVGLWWVGRRERASLQQAAAAEQTLLLGQLEALDARLARALAVRREWAARIDTETLGAALAAAQATRLLRQGELAPPQREQVERIAAGLHRVQDTLHLLVDAAQLEAGALALAPEPFDVDALLREFGDALSARMAARLGELVVQLEHDVPQALLGDAPRLLHLLLASAEGVLVQGTGDLSLHIGLDEPRVGLPAPAPGERLCLRFELEAGMDAGAMPDEDSSGLAATVRAQVLRMMGGQSGQRDVGGLGRVAWFTAVCQVADAPGQTTESAPDLAGRRVLVVDDGERARTMLVQLLGHWGLKVTAVNSGYAGIHAASSAENAGPGFELMLLDAEMPDLGGLETVRLLHTSGLRRPPAVVLLSGDPAGALLAQADEAGVAEVLGKPVSRSALRRSLQNLLHKRADSNGAEPVGAAREAGVPPALLALGGARVLLVEDNEINQQIALELLQASGMEVQLAEHGQAALDLLNWQYFDLVLMDLQMPVLDGLSATRQIRADRRHVNLPIIAMTAAGSQLERQRCLEAGMNAHLIKPFDLDGLWAVLERWIAPRPGLGTALGAEIAGGADAATAPARLVNVPQNMPGFDVRRALRRMGDRVELYLRTARMFVDTQADAVEQVREALAAGDRVTAIRLATTLKNLAGNLGAEALQTEALALEACLREGVEAMFSPRAARVAEALEVVCFAIQPMLVSMAPKRPVPVPASVAGLDS